MPVFDSCPGWPPVGRIGRGPSAGHNLEERTFLATRPPKQIVLKLERNAWLNFFHSCAANRLALISRVFAAFPGPRNQLLNRIQSSHNPYPESSSARLLTHQYEIDEAIKQAPSLIPHCR